MTQPRSNLRTALLSSTATRRDPYAGAPNPLRRTRTTARVGSTSSPHQGVGNDRYLRTAGDWNRRIVFSNTAAKLGSDSPRSLAGPPVFLRAMISERRACADSDFICTGLKKAVRARYASPGASLRSVLWVSVRACSRCAHECAPPVRVSAGRVTAARPRAWTRRTSTYTSSSTSNRDPQTLRAGGRVLFKELRMKREMSGEPGGAWRAARRNQHNPGLAGFLARPDREMAANGRRKSQRRGSGQIVSLSF